ncbi:MAG: hypothetical protein ACE5IQ_09500 [Candidatus Methylomirabilales bacterium]
MKSVCRVIGLCMAPVLALAACTPAEGPESVARSFVERYYVQPDLPKAKALAYGLARRKIEDEERLLQAVARATGAAGRDVSYRLHTTRKVGDIKVLFVYDLTISVDRRVFKKQAIIATGRVKEGWRVTNFQDADL